MSEVWLPKRGYVTTQIERDALDAIIESVEQALGDRPYFENDNLPVLAERGLAIMREALAEYDEEAVIETGRQERRAAAEQVARETPQVAVRIRITKRISFKGGAVLTKGTVLDVVRSVRAEYDVDTRDWASEVSYSYVQSRSLSGGSIGLSIPADYATEV